MADPSDTHSWQSKRNNRSLKRMQKDKDLHESKDHQPRAQPKAIRAQQVSRSSESILLDVQSARPSLRAFLEFVIKRKVTRRALAMHKAKPTPKTALDSEGGSMKFGGAPLGLAARGILDGSIC